MSSKVEIAWLTGNPENSLFSSGKRFESTVQVLMEDIRRNGLILPILIASDGLILSGHKRTEACRRLGWTHIDADIRQESGRQALQLLITQNTARANVTFDERVAIYKRWEPDILTKDRIPRKFIEKVSREISIPFNTILKDITKYRNPQPEKLTVEAVRDLWNQKNRGTVRVNLIDCGAGTYILQVSGRNFKYESGPASLSRVLQDSHNKAKSDYFDRSFKDNNMRAGSRLREIRQKLKLTQVRMADRLGLSQSYYAEIEAGKYDAASEIVEQCELMLLEAEA